MPLPLGSVSSFYLRRFQVRRIVEMDHKGSVLWSGALILEKTSPPLLLTELAAFEDSGALALLRSWSRSKGNDIRLYSLDLRGAFARHLFKLL